MAHGSASNFIRQTVGSSVGTTDPETIDVQDASAFPDPSTSEYDIVIWDAGSFNRPDQDSNVEVLTVTGRDIGNNTLTCARGQQGTSNTSHPNTSDVIIAPLSVGDFNTVRSQSVTTDDATFDGPDGSTFNPFNHILFHDAQNGTTEYYPVQGESDTQAGSTLSTVLSAATEDSWIYLPPRTYEGAFVHDTRGLALFSFGNQGAILNGGTTGHALEADYDGGSPYQGSVRNLSFVTTTGGGNAFDCIHVTPPASGDGSNFDVINCHLLGSDRYGLYGGQNITQFRMEGGQNPGISTNFDDDIIHWEGERSYIECIGGDNTITLTANSSRNAVLSKMSSRGDDSGIDVTITDNGTENAVKLADSYRVEELRFNPNHLSVGSVTTFEETIEGSNSGFGRGFQLTDGVSTSATSIYDRLTSESLQGNLVVVYGRVQGGNDEFTDIVVWNNLGSPATLGSSESGSPTSRTYTDGTGMELAMGSGTYNIAAYGIGAQTAN